MLEIITTFVKGIKWNRLKVSIAINIALIIVVFFLTREAPAQEPEIIIKERVITLPAKEGKLDTIYQPKYIGIKNPANEELLNQYNSLKDSIEKENLFKEAIAEREYKEVYEDSIIKIDIYSKVAGKLLSQAPTYKIKPVTIITKDTISIVYNKPPKNRFLWGVDVGIPIRGEDLTLKGSIYLQNKKHNLISLGFDSNKTVWVGLIRKF